MPGRTFTSSIKYRYGFNGQESDFEVFNSGGTSYTAEFWQYDSRLGRRWNIDPVDQISISNYATFANNPILLNDPNGNTPGEGDPKKAKSVPECEGDGCKTVRGPVSPDGNNGGYDVNIPAGATTVNQKQSFSIAGKPDNVIDVTTGFGYYEGDEFKYYGWSSEMNGFYNYKTNEVYGGDGVAIAEGYINSQMGTQVGSPYHPSYSTGATIGGTQNVVNTVAAVGSLASTGARMALKYGIRGGWGVFGKNGANVLGYKINLLYQAKMPGTGTIFSMQNKTTGFMLRFDYGALHGTNSIGNHSTFRFNWFGNTYGSTKQYPMYAPLLFPKYKQVKIGF
jgi:hypothetical protein